MIKREYLTEYDEYLHSKAYAESVCEKEDAPKFCEDASDGGDTK